MLKDFNKYFTISSYLQASNASSSLPVPCLRPSLAAEDCYCPVIWPLHCPAWRPSRRRPSPAPPSSTSKSHGLSSGFTCQSTQWCTGDITHLGFFYIFFIFYLFQVRDDQVLQQRARQRQILLEHELVPAEDSLLDRQHCTFRVQPSISLSKYSEVWT